MSGVFNPILFNAVIFNTGAAGPIVEEIVKSGTGGIDGGGIVKPSGLPIKRPTLHLKKKNQVLEDRLRQQIDDQIEISSILSKSLEENVPRESTGRELSLSEIQTEISALLHKKLRTEEEEIVLLLLMAACNSLDI